MIAEIALKTYHLQSVDTSNMTPKQYAEFVAEELADVAYTIASTAVMQKAKNMKVPEGFVRMTREMFQGNNSQVAVAGNGSVSVQAPEGPTLQARSTQKVKGGSEVRVLDNKTTLQSKTIQGKTFIEVNHPVLDSVKTGSALKLDPHHVFNKSLSENSRHLKKP